MFWSKLQQAQNEICDIPANPTPTARSPNMDATNIDPNSHSSIMARFTVKMNS